MIGTEYALQRTSRTTPFLRQVELFSGVSFRSQAINDDRTIQRIAGGIRDLQGFNEEDRENFRKQIILTSIDFDSGELRIVEKNSVRVSISFYTLTPPPKKIIMCPVLVEMKYHT